MLPIVSDPSRLSSAQRSASAYSPRRNRIWESVPAEPARQRLRVAEGLGQLAGAAGGALRLLERGPAEHDAQAREPAGRRERRRPRGRVVPVHLGQFPEPAVEVDRRAVRGQVLRVLGSAEERRHRFRAVVAARVVVREQRRALGARLARLRLEEERDALVELAALLQEQALVGDLLRQALAEAVLVARQQALAVENAAALELGQLALEVDALAVEDAHQLAAVELAAEHGR